MGHVLQDGVAELAQLGSRTLWATDGEFYWDEEGFTLEEAQLEVWDLKRRRDRKYDRLRKVRERGEETEVARREQIPEEVRDFVWTRDEGRCARCGAEDDLQFDHVIPVSKGGGSSADNLQILCGECNRKKGASIG